jgi:SPP1 gp7 family putative phage head morphogenesis protein
VEQTDRWITRAGARLDGITADILRLLEERDRWYLEDCVRMVELTEEAATATSVGYPAMADLEEVAARAIEAGWSDAEAEVLAALEGLGERVLEGPVASRESRVTSQRRMAADGGDGVLTPDPSPPYGGERGERHGGRRTAPHPRPLSPIRRGEERTADGGDGVLTPGPSPPYGGERGERPGGRQTPGRRVYGELTRAGVAEAVGLVVDGERLVVPRDGIDRYVERRIPPLRWTIEEARKLLVRDLVAEAAREGLDVRRTMQLLQREGIERSAWNRETIARTEAGTLYNHGRLARYRASACVSGYRFSSVLDDRTTPICEQMHGRCFRKDEIDGVEPPQHFNCRSLLVPIILDEKQDWERAEDVLAGLDERERPQAGFGGVDLASMPAPRSIGDLYRPLLESEKAELRDLYVVILGRLGAAVP